MADPSSSFYLFIFYFYCTLSFNLTQFCIFWPNPNPVVFVPNRDVLCAKCCQELLFVVMMTAHCLSNHVKNLCCCAKYRCQRAPLESA